MRRKLAKGARAFWTLAKNWNWSGWRKTKLRSGAGSFQRTLCDAKNYGDRPFAGRNGTERNETEWDSETSVQTPGFVQRGISERIAVAMRAHVGCVDATSSR